MGASFSHRVTYYDACHALRELRLKGDTKAGNAQASGAEYITSTDRSCLLHIDGILRRRNSKVRTIYLANILARTSSTAERKRPVAAAGTVL